ncbi:peptidoglycan-binding domain-containing protein [uncultured Roseobacter sp.]|uniref:peptidoglycan-binding domain-containing protein n=1 Tax=uncultured Roseobacter sp. TaxID=114847 RepID=UPI00260D88ED|nr:peptidoglycan-binding domain-containing protein [uncultured Roseobacter sp.]
MKQRNTVSAALAAAMMLTTSTAMADSNLGAFAVGAAVGAIVNQQVNNNKKKQQTVQRQNYSNSYQRQQNREVQSSLNAFGFPVGVVDGSLGRRSRTAIANYQAYMGYPATGYLEEYQRIALVSSHQRLQAGGGSAYPQVVANEGTQGLLKAFADPNYAASRYGGAAPAAPNTTTAAAVAPLAPLSLSGAQSSASMVSHCKVVNTQTQANGVILASNVTNPDQALGEQFCDARADAIRQSDLLRASVDQSDAQLRAGCTQISDAMSPAISEIATQGAASVAVTAQQTANALFNGDMATAAGYGKICLGLGYREDDAAMALGAATVMLATGQAPYAEFVGHHVRWGFGTDAPRGSSLGWYDTALTAMENGAEPAVLPAKKRARNAVIRASISTVAPAPVQALSGGGALPALNLNKN